MADAFKIVPEGIALFDADDRYVIWSHRYAEIYGAIADLITVGASFEEVVRAALDKGLIADAVGREEEWLAKRLAEHNSASQSSEHRLQGDKWVRADERRTADGGTVSVRADITELKQREASFRLLFESNPIPMFVCNAKNLAFLAVNAAAVHHYGYVGRQFSEMSVYDLRRSNDWEDLKQRTLAGDVGRQSGEVRRHVKADGSEIDVAVYTTPMRYQGVPAVLTAAIDVTERLRAEARLRKQRWRTDIALNNLTQGLVMFDADERLVLVNPRFIELYGLSPNIVKVGYSALELMKHRESLGVLLGDADKLHQDLVSRLAERKPWRRLIELPDHRVIQIVYRPLTDGGWVSTHEDITERQRAEVKIREQKLQLDATIDNMVQGLVMFDADQCLVQWNKRYIDMFGLSPDIVKAGCSALDLMKHRKELGVFPGDPEAYCERRLARIAEGEPWSFVLDLPDGRTIRATHRPMAGGGCVSTHEDITERRETERALQEREARLSAIMDNAADAIITIDDQGIIESFNHTAEQIFGYSEKEIRGQNIKILVPVPEQSEHDGYIANYLKTGKGRIIGIGPREVTAQRKDGSAVQLSLAISTMDIGEEKKLIGIAREITVRQQA